MVVLAYLPDIVAQLGLLAGWSDGRLLGHSVIFALAVSAAVAVGLMRLAKASFPRAFAVALGSLLIHDILDLAQATDRAPWWPLSDRPLGVDLGVIPTGLLREAALFGGLLMVFLALRHVAHRWAAQTVANPSVQGRAHVRVGWSGQALIIVVVSAAVITLAL